MLINIHVRVGQQVLDDIKTEAAGENRSVSNMVSVLLAECKAASIARTPAPTKEKRSLCVTIPSETRDAYNEIFENGGTFVNVSDLYNRALWSALQARVAMRAARERERLEKEVARRADKAAK